MVTFCTVKDVRAALTSNADATDTETPAKFPAWQIEDAIAEAEGIVKSYILTRYRIPIIEYPQVTGGDNPSDAFQAAPAPVRGWTRSIAAYLLTLTYMKNKDVGEDDPVRLRYNLSLTSMVAIRDRAMDLPADDFPSANSDNDQGVFVVNQYEGNLFGMEDQGIGPDIRDRQVRIPGWHW